MEYSLAIEKALQQINVNTNRAIYIKEEQKTAVVLLLRGRDVLAILPTGFGKSFIYILFALAQDDLLSSKSTLVVVSPLQSTAKYYR